MTTLDIDSQVFEFIEAVVQQRRLREGLSRIFDGIEDLSRNLDEEASHSVLINVRGLLETLSIQIADTDARVRELLPAMRACLEADIAVSNLSTSTGESYETHAESVTSPEPETFALAAQSAAGEAEPPVTSLESDDSSGMQRSFTNGALPWEGGIADTMAPEDPAAETAGPSVVFSALPPGLDDVEEGGGELREEDMLFWLRENDDEDLAMTLPRATTLGIGDRVHAKVERDDDEITQIFDKGDFE